MNLVHKLKGFPRVMYYVGDDMEVSFGYRIEIKKKIYTRMGYDSAKSAYKASEAVKKAVLSRAE